MKRILLFIAFAAVFITAAVICVSAEEPTVPVDVWDGTADTDWYYNAPGRYEYVLKSAEQLAGLAELVNVSGVNFENVTIKLGADIVLNEGEFGINEYGAPLYNGEEPYVMLNPPKVWPVIGKRPVNSNSVKLSSDPNHFFTGSFDGQGHVISGMYIFDNQYHAGFFSVFGGQSLKNLSIVNSYISCASRAGSFAGFVTNDDQYPFAAENLYSDTYITLSNADNNAGTGGIFGRVRYTRSTELYNLWFAGRIEAKVSNSTRATNYIGGIVSVIAQEDAGDFIYIEGCLMTGSIYGNENVESDTQTNAYGGLVANIYTRGNSVDVSVCNCIVAVRDTNIGQDSFLIQDGKSAFVGRFEKPNTNYTVKDSFFIPKGMFSTANSVTNVIGNGSRLNINGTEIIDTAFPLEEIIPEAEIQKFSDAWQLNGMFALDDSSAILLGIRNKVGSYEFDAEGLFDNTAPPETEAPETLRPMATESPKTERPEADATEKSENSENEEAISFDFDIDCDGISLMAVTLALTVTGAALAVIKKKD